MPFPDDILSQYNKPPQKAVEFLRKKYPKLTWNYDDLDSEAHARAFTIAKVTQMDILLAVMQAIDVSVTAGTGYERFQKSLEPYLKLAGWWGEKFGLDENGNAVAVQAGSDTRLHRIWKTNTDQAVASGRWQQMQEAGVEFLQYRIDQRGVSTHHRADHELLDNMVWAFDDPAWDVIYPPKGFGCNCGAVSVTQRYMKRKGLTAQKSDIVQVEVTDRRTGEVRLQNALRINGNTIMPDKGFEAHVGKSACWQPDLNKYPAALASKYLQASMPGPAYERFFTGKDAGTVPVGIQNTNKDTMQTVMMESDTVDSSIAADQYAQLWQVIEQAELLVSKAGTLHAVRKQGESYWQAQMQERNNTLFVVSYAPTTDKEITQLKKKGKILRDNL